MSKPGSDIPHNLQPRPADYAFDLEHALRSVVALRTEIPTDAFTAEALGTERAGSGVVIEGGVVLTMGYLILESETVWLSTQGGQVLPGHPLAVDFETGFGLVQPLGRLDLPSLPFGDPAKLGPGDSVLLAASGGRPRALETKIIARQEFAGYWEYVLDDALFTAPAHPFWGGAALIGAEGGLIGIGSLILQQGDGTGRRTDMNMVVPITPLRAILPDLLRHGRSMRPARPWLGIYAMESDEEIVVGGLANNGPADRAGLKPGDRILAVDGDSIPDLAGLWRQVWSLGSAGTPVRLTVQRDEETLHLTIPSADRTTYLRAPRMH